MAFYMTRQKILAFRVNRMFIVNLTQVRTLQALAVICPLRCNKDNRQ